MPISHREPIPNPCLLSSIEGLFSDYVRGCVSSMPPKPRRSCSAAGLAGTNGPRAAGTIASAGGFGISISALFGRQGRHKSWPPSTGEVNPHSGDRPCVETSTVSGTARSGRLPLPSSGCRWKSSPSGPRQLAVGVHQLELEQFVNPESHGDCSAGCCFGAAYLLPAGRALPLTAKIDPQKLPLAVELGLGHGSCLGQINVIISTI